MGGPEHAEPFAGNESAHDADHALARADVETDGRLVEQQQAGAMQQGAGDLDTPRLAAGQSAHLLVGAIREADDGQGLLGALSGLAAPDAVQRGVVHEVLGQREILVERARLEDDTEALQGRARPPAHVVAQNADLARDVVVETRDEREERRLAGAVETEQHGEGAARDRDGDVVEHEVVAEAVAHSVDHQRVGCGLGLIWRGFVHLTMYFPMAPVAAEPAARLAGA